jgi:hypothetical protein
MRQASNRQLQHLNVGVCIGGRTRDSMEDEADDVQKDSLANKLVRRLLMQPYADVVAALDPMHVHEDMYTLTANAQKVVKTYAETVISLQRQGVKLLRAAAAQRAENERQGAELLAVRAERLADMDRHTCALADALCAAKASQASLRETLQRTRTTVEGERRALSRASALAERLAADRARVEASLTRLSAEAAEAGEAKARAEVELGRMAAEAAEAAEAKARAEVAMVRMAAEAAEQRAGLQRSVRDADELTRKAAALAYRLADVQADLRRMRHLVDGGEALVLRASIDSILKPFSPGWAAPTPAKSLTKTVGGVGGVGGAAEGAGAPGGAGAPVRVR